MKKSLLMCLLLVASFLSNSASFATPQPIITKDASAMAKTFRFEDRDYVVSVSQEPITIKYDFDGDGNIETLVGFQGETDPKLKAPLSFIALIKDENGKPNLDFITAGNDYFSKVELKDVDKDGLLEILFWSAGGAHYTNLDIYKYTHGKMNKLFSNGSACKVSVEDKTPFAIKIGREKWNNPNWSYAAGTDLWEIWEWNSKEFVKNK